MIKEIRTAIFFVSPCRIFVDCHACSQVVYLYMLDCEPIQPVPILEQLVQTGRSTTHTQVHAIGLVRCEIMVGAELQPAVQIRQLSAANFAYFLKKTFESAKKCFQPRVNGLPPYQPLQKQRHAKMIWRTGLAGRKQLWSVCVCAHAIPTHSESCLFKQIPQGTNSVQPFPMMLFLWYTYTFVVFF